MNTDENALHAVDYWQIVKNRYAVILLSFLIIFLTAVVITSVMPKKYESSAKVQVNPSIQDINPTMIGGRRAGSEQLGSNRTRHFLKTEFEVITSENTLKLVIEQLDLESRWKVTEEVALMQLRGMVSTREERGTDMIHIIVKHPKPDEAQAVAEAVASAYKTRRTEMEMSRAKLALDALDDEIEEQVVIVEQKRKTLNAIMKATNVAYWGHGNNNNQSRPEVIDDMRIRQKITEAEMNVQTFESYIAELGMLEDEALISYAAGLGLSIPGGNSVPRLYQQYQELSIQQDMLQASGLGRKHPKMKMVAQSKQRRKEQLDEAINNLQDNLKVQLRLAKNNLEKLEDSQAEKGEGLVTKAIEQQEYLNAKNDFEEAKSLLQQLRLNLTSERIAHKIPRHPITIHENPKVGNKPVSPNVMLNMVLGAIFGLVLGIGLAFILEFMDTSVKSLEDVERYLQTPVLAVIPKDVGVLHKQSGMSPDAEAYRILRTNIEFNRKNPDDNSITVVSGGASEGKSTTMVNLAYVCAQGGYTTLMIDADLRRPRLHTFFEVSNSVGLTNYLTTDLMLEDVILQTPIDNLYFMPSGVLPADASGILNSRRMSELIQDVKQRFDLVLIDSPPILGVSDASVLASEVDLTLIVVQHRKLPRNMLVRVKQAVENVGGQVIGVVLNNVDVRSDNKYQYYTSYYTYYAPSTEVSQSAGARAGERGESSVQASKSNDPDLY